MSDKPSKSNQRGSPERQKLMSLRTRRCVALLCAAAVWFSFNLASSVQAAQHDAASQIRTEHEQGINGPITPSIVTSPDSVADSGSHVAMAAVSLLMIGLLGYNLATSGKRGWGWAALCIVGTIVAIVGKLAVSLFQEISSPNSITDWDSD